MKSVIRSIFFLYIFIKFPTAQWSEQNSGVTTDLYCVSAVNNNVVWIGGAAGKVLLTTNGGTNWLVYTVPVNTLDLGSIWGIDANTALVTGTGASSLVYKTTNAGANWIQVFSQSGGYINAIWMSSENNGFMMGDPVNNRWSLWKTSNGGSNWDSTGLYLPDTAGVLSFNNALFSTGSHIWFGTNGRKIYYSSNSGINWIAQDAAGKVITAVIWFNTLNTGMAGGSSPIIFTTTGGNSWAAVPGTTSTHGMTGYESFWWYVRVIGTIYYTSNNGANWSTVYTAPSGLYFHLSRARNNTKMWAVRSGGGISKYTASPTEVTNFTILKINELKDNINELVSSGNLRDGFGKVLINFLNNSIMQLNNGHPEVAIIQMELFKSEVNRLIERGFLTPALGQTLIENADETNTLIQGLVGGDNNDHIQNGITSFALNQNFPNPFNPETKIEFRISDFGLVTLIVYDVLGKEISALLNEEKLPGNYVFIFDGSDLSSGVYFYSLKFWNFIETKKMFLLR